MIKEMIKKAAEGVDLTYDEAAEVTREIMTGSTTPAQTAAYLTALHIKGETTDEISASAYVLSYFFRRISVFFQKLFYCCLISHYIQSKVYSA